MPEDMFSCTNQTTYSFYSFDEELSVTETISKVQSIVSSQTLPGMVEAPSDEAVLLFLLLLTIRL